MNNNGKLTPRQERFISLVLQGETLTKAYTLSFPRSETSKLRSIGVKASQVFNLPHVHERYLELREVMEKELQERAVWTKEQSINELKDMLYANKKEMMRYEKAYDDEMEMLERQIVEREDEMKKPRVAKKLLKELQAEIDKLKMAEIMCNRRHQSNRSVNEAILSSIMQLNDMLGYNKKEDQEKSIQMQAQVQFVDNIPETDEEDEVEENN